MIIRNLFIHTFQLIKLGLINVIDEKSKISIVQKEILNIFINSNTKFTHLYLPYKFTYQIHLIPGAKSCLSELQFFSCDASVNENILIGLVGMCNTIREIEIIMLRNEKISNSYGIVRLIEAQKKLSNVHFVSNYQKINEEICEILENSLIKHANTIQYFGTTKQPITKFLSSFINLKRLELNDNFVYMSWNHLENLSLPSLQILKARSVPVKILASLIENTSGYLTEIKIDRIRHDVNNNKRIIQSIYQNCPMLKYLKLLFIKSNFLELEKLLISCQYLIGLYIIFEDVWDNYVMINWNHLFKILTQSSPSGLFKFKFYYSGKPKLESLKLFFDNWKNKNPMLLQTTQLCKDEYIDLIERYKAKGIIKKFNDNLYAFDDFEWIQRIF
ncbi:hypothetical protein RclHR1_01810004 [Rhizophagus clarus]|uniref:F-box domain-containing protein n=1 Tax=Rhizophagus clarus TaxID=94130 RepID=A0A2Z6R218_9GLOM|nr:hypothetical protein RclHR1_01810004 [Rhizophagus clarus]